MIRVHCNYDWRLWSVFLLRIVSAVFCALGVVPVDRVHCVHVCAMFVLEKEVLTKTRAECEGEEGRVVEKRDC